ncbi:MAG: hypothetical protein GWP91_08035 [Rhodobacterales bacterium]|nr:hypothetical protein [Rhodobacterales bacterium]
MTDGIVAHTLTYNASGQLVSDERDIEGDTVIDFATTYAYDPNGQVSVISSDFDADGVDDQVETHSFYASGNLEWAYLDYENDGTDDVEFHFIEVGGDIITLEIDGADGGGIDGIIDEMSVYTYDGNGDMLRESVDLGNDGVDDDYLDFQRPGDFGGDYAILRDGPVATYDALGVLTGYDPALPDGTVDDWTEFTFDASGRVEFAYFDFGNDGVVDATYDWLYNPDGTVDTQVGEILYGEANILDDGFLDLIMEYTYDADGYLTEVYVLADIDSDGAVGPLDLVATDIWTWTCP